MSTINVTAAELRALAGRARGIGTLKAFTDVALQWAGLAEKEIERLTAERDEHARWRQKLADDLHDRETQIIELRRVYMPVESGGICPSPTAYYPVELAPDAPQAEPKREPNPDEVICPACTHQFRAIPENVQAQLWAKREPLSDEQIDTALQTYPATLLALMGGEMTVGEFKSALRRLARTVEHAHGIGGGDE